MSGLFCFLIFLIILKISLERKEKGEMEKKSKFVSEVGFEPTPTRVDCDLNAAP